MNDDGITLLTAPARRRIDGALAAVTTLLVFAALYWTFMVVPNERLMGAMQRIVYFHAGCAVASYVCFLALFFGSVGFLLTHVHRWITLAVAAGEVAFILCAIVLATGMIWGHAAWNTWFRFEPRLVTFLLLWLLLLGFNALQRLGDTERQDAHLAALGILTSFTVPVMVYSVQLLPQAEQLHPQVVAKGGFAGPGFLTALLLSMAAMSSLALLLMWVRTRLGELEVAIAELER